MIDGHFALGGGVGDFDGDAGQQLADGAVARRGQHHGIGFRRGVGQVDVGGGRGFGEAVAFLRTDAEFFLEGVGERLGEFFRAGDHEFERGELGGIDAFHVAAQEGGRGEQHVDLMEGDELGQALRFQRGGVGDEVDALDDREPQRDGAAERVEQRQAAEDGGIGRKIEARAELRDVGQQVAVAEHDALRLAG